MQYMKRLLFLLLIIMVFACKAFDPVEIAKSNPQVKQFLEEHPNANIRVVEISQSQSQLILDEIQIVCGVNMKAKDYSKITITDGQYKMFIYVSTTVECLYQQGPEKEINNTKIEEPKTITNEIRDVKIIALERSPKEKQINVLITQDNIMDSFNLRFNSECKVWKVQSLLIKLNDKFLYHEIPKCGQTTTVDVSEITEGYYNLEFSTKQGPYLISDIEFADLDIDEFELDGEEKEIIVVEYPSVALSETKYFSLDADILNPVLSFDTAEQGIISVELNGDNIFQREILSPARVKLNNLLKEQNTLRFVKKHYDPKCNNVALDIFEKNGEKILCIIPEESEIQMIIKNTGTETIEKIDMFVKGDTTSMDTFEIDLLPGQIYTKVLNYGDLRKIKEIMLTPILDNDIMCRSISFTDVRDC